MSSKKIRGGGRGASGSWLVARKKEVRANRCVALSSCPEACRLSPLLVDATNGPTYDAYQSAGRLVKLADTQDLGSCAERRRGSSPRAAILARFLPQLLERVSVDSRIDLPTSHVQYRHRSCGAIRATFDVQFCGAGLIQVIGDERAANSIGGVALNQTIGSS